MYTDCLFLTIQENFLRRMAHSSDISSIIDPTPLLWESAKDEIDEGRKADHLIEIMETNGQNGSVLRAHKSVNQIFDERFKALEHTSIKSTTIFKVTAGLRESNPDAYMPKLVSIGPYHRNNPQLDSMEKYKLLYLQRFLHREKGIDVENCLRELEKVKNEILKCYDDIGDLNNDMNTGQFLQMMLLDGCFVIEFIRDKFSRMWPKGEKRIIGNGCIDIQVRRDLLLIENQLPFFVLTKLDDMTKNVNQKPFIQMVKETLLHELPKMTPGALHEKADNNAIKHLVHLIHMSCRPSKTEALMPKDKDELTWIEIMPNATELSEAGVRFASVGKIYRSFHMKDNIRDSTSLFDIRFKNGIMEIPCFEVHVDTESIMRNLIAYEQQSSRVHPRYFSDFAIFMDYLIDSDKDVSLLRRKGIISNRMGEDKEVAYFFNKIGKGVTISHDFYYKHIFMKVAQHCEKPWNNMKANLRRNYFNNPWAGVSTVAAIMLLLFTLTQTILAFISILK